MFLGEFPLTRKATDVLLSIETDVKKILAHVQNQDLLAKTLNNKISQLEKRLENQPVTKPVPASVPIQKQMPGLKPGIQLKETGPNKNQLVKSIGTNPEQLHKSVPVQQMVLFPNGTGVAMAHVEIFSGSSLVKNLKTNTVGKWTNALSPGPYTIHVFKKATNTSQAIESTKDIEVPDSAEPVQLEVFQT
jgi:hypothetical protein